jgi:hypothetical protein
MIMNVRQLLLAAGLLPLALAAAGAQVRHIDVGAAEPSALFVDKSTGRLNLLTAGYDRNFDGLFEADSGDVLPRWLAIDPSSERVVDSLTFGAFFSSFPIRVGVDQAGHRLFVPMGGRISSYDIATMKPIRDTFALGSYAAVSYDSLGGRVIAAARPGFTDPGYILTLDALTGDTLMIVETGVNPGMSVTRWSPVINGPEQYTLIEGSFTSPTSQIAYSVLQRDVFIGGELGDLGGGANQIVVKRGRAYVVLGGTHKIRIVDTRTHQDAAAPITIGTSGFDGPRMLDFQNDSVVVVATYAGDIRRFNVNTGAAIDSIALPGRVEAVAVRDSLAFAAIEYQAGSYSYDSLVVAVNLNTGLPVDTIAVGLNPSALFVDKRGDIQVVVADSLASAQRLVVLDGATLARKGSRPLAGALTFPVRVAYDAVDDSLYMVLGDSVIALPASSTAAAGRVVYADPAKTGLFQSVTLDGGNVLVTERPKNFGTEPGYVHIVERASGHRIAKFRAGTFVATAVRIAGERDSAISYYALNEGSFPSANSTISLFEYQPNIFGADTLGKGINHITQTSANYAVVTMNGSHMVVVTDLANWQAIVRAPVGTSGFDGPRESMLLDNKNLMVTTYAGDVRILNPSTLNAVRPFPVGGRAEGIAMAGGKVFAAVPFLPGSYAPASLVAVIDSARAASVTRESSTASATRLEGNYPNPASEKTVIRFSVAEPTHAVLSIHAATGELVMTLLDRDLERGAYSADVEVAGLPSGSYLYTLRAGGRTLGGKMEVVR